MRQWIKTFFFVLLFLMVPKICLAETEINQNNNEELVFTMKDKKATSSIIWTTEGYTVKAGVCLPEGNPRMKPYGEFMITPDMKSDPYVFGSYVYTTFIIPKVLLENQIERAGTTKETLEKSGGKIYLNAIFQVWIKNSFGNYIKNGSLKYTLSTIKSAASWMDPSTFKNHFDLYFQYNPKAQPAQITYAILKDNKWETVYNLSTKNEKWIKVYQSGLSIKSGNGLNFKSNQYKTHLDSVKPDGYSIPARISGVVDGLDKQYYLYRVHWSYLKDNKKEGTNGLYRPVKGMLKTTVNPLTDWDAYVKDLDRIRKRAFEMQLGGIEIVAVYKTYKKTDPSGMEGDLIEPVPTGVIQAEVRGNEQFDSTEGIPTTESQYVNVFTTDYLRQYRFQNYTGTKTYYQKEWYTEKNDKGELVSKSRQIPVNRSYSYWKIEELNVYKINRTEVENYSLPGGKVTIYPSAVYKAPVVSYDRNGHIEDPGGIGTENVGEIKCYNDKLIFNGTTVMNSAMHYTSAPAPSNIPVGKKIDKDIFYLTGQIIGATKENGDFESSGTVYYTPIVNIGGESSLSYEMEEINNVVIHTPTICDAKVQDVKKYNQMIYPNQGISGLVLDQSFYVEVPTIGYHTDLPGYGFRDYQKYITKREVKFPFDVYYGSAHFKADTWLTLSQERTEFYLPIWVDEGEYTIDFRSRAINCDANGGLEQTEDLANTDYSNYVAVDTAEVEVSGCVYGLSLYDVSDYPIWEPVFRIGQSTASTGVTYTLGTNDQNGTATGRNSKYTLPMVNGSHAFLANQGILKTGYTQRFYLTTIGNMYEDMDTVEIQPRFYYIDGKGMRREVDVYYSETIKGTYKNLIKMGSELDNTNEKKMMLGNTYTSVSKAEIQDKVWITGKTEKEVKAAKTTVYRYAQIIIPEELRVYTGKNYTPTGIVPLGVDEKKVAASRQKWYFEYSIPSEIHIVEKGFNVYDYGRRNGGLDYSENFWLDGGYLCVNFDIITKNGEEKRLSYTNAGNAATGYCNMWKLEGYTYQKMDFIGSTYEFIDGDTLLYYLNKSAKKDYRSAGTH